MEIVTNNKGSSDPHTVDTFCFLCSNNQVSPDYSNKYLSGKGLQSSDDEKLKILTVICELLRVKWDIVQNLFNQNVHFPFCEPCLKSVIHMISVREQLFLMESDVREKIRQIESSIAKNYEPQVKFDQLELKETKTNDKYFDYRQSFQAEVMEEYWNKELLREKIEELNRIQNNFVQVDLSLTQLQLEKSVFRITKIKKEGITTENLEGEYGIMDEKSQFTQESMDISGMCETQLNYSSSEELELNLECPIKVDRRSYDDNLGNDDNNEFSTSALRVFAEGMDIIDNSRNSIMDQPSMDRITQGEGIDHSGNLFNNNGIYYGYHGIFGDVNEVIDNSNDNRDFQLPSDELVMRYLHSQLPRKPSDIMLLHWGDFVLNLESGRHIKVPKNLNP